MKRILAFGAFDPLTAGQKDFLEQAKALGDHLTVVVAHESAIRAHKKRDQYQSEQARLEAVKKLDIADEVILGRKAANKFHILSELAFDVIAMGFEQSPDDEVIRKALDEMGKHHVEIVRCRQYTPRKAAWQLILKIFFTTAAVAVVLAVAFVALQVTGR